jgi:hypothetical protein
MMFHLPAQADDDELLFGTTFLSPFPVKVDCNQTRWKHCDMLHFTARNFHDYPSSVGVVQ